MFKVQLYICSMNCQMMSGTFIMLCFGPFHSILRALFILGRLVLYLQYMLQIFFPVYLCVPVFYHVTF